ncbi:DUF726 domain-containing protein [Massilia sp. IC2-278]|uniref:DUF726 domain-containing protein n=1 Tax=Massilia sp. IC2-278 TaxID=2887200 RepID=UPI001E5E9C62|nr:DUF726 domain-containing protein [Massilia sp. IC2-278]MCC2961002.1 DUF726 domain-containing protein [Massilia sp. IC2-278]
MFKFASEKSFSDIEEYPGPTSLWGRLADASFAGTVVNALGKGVSGVDSHSNDLCRFRKIRSGNRHGLIVVNGFLSQGDKETRDWEHVIEERYRHSTIYHLDWNAAKSPAAVLGELASIKGIADLIATWPTTPVADFMLAWHRAMLSAHSTGRALADAITHTPGWRFTLAGHSLGARVIHFALKKLGTDAQCTIDSAYLLGGAVGGGAKDDKCWATAATAVKGKIYNCYSSRDDVLQWAYRGANAMLSNPIGLSGINYKHKRIVELDCTRFVGGHMQWKPQFDEVLRGLRAHAIL